MTSPTSTPSADVAPHYTAAIIPFPVRAAAAPQRPEDRLTRALEALNVAMIEQRLAVAAWRDALGELKTTTASLDVSMQHYRANLRSLGGSLSSLRTKARSLEQWANSVAGPTG